MLPNRLVATSVVVVPVSMILSPEPEIVVAVNVVILATVNDMPLSLTFVVCTSLVRPVAIEDVAFEITSGDIDDVGLAVPVEVTLVGSYYLLHGDPCYFEDQTYSLRSFVKHEMPSKSYLKSSSPFAVSSDVFTNVAVFSTFIEEHRSAVNKTM